MDGIVPTIAAILLLGFIATLLTTMVLLFLSFRKRFKSKTPYHISIFCTALLAVMFFIALIFSSTGIGIEPSMVIFGLLLASGIANYRIAKNTVNLRK